MLKNRLIPVVILNDNNVVQSVNFKHTNVIGNAITAVDFFNRYNEPTISKWYDCRLCKRRIE